MTLQEWLYGLGFNFVPILDNKLHRCDREGTKRDDNVWYVGSEEMLPSGKMRSTITIGDHKTGEKHSYKPDKYETFTDEERAYYAKKQKEAEEQNEKEKRSGQEKAAKEAGQIWENSGPVTGSNYLVKKGIGGAGADSWLGGVRQSGDVLLIPMRDIEGKLWGIQRIWPDGTKRFLTGQRKSETFFKLDGRSDSFVAICEGFATACSIHQATGFETYVGFDSGNLIHVIRCLKDSGKRILVCGDDDRWNPSGKNVGREKATEAALLVGGIAVFPEFKELENDTSGMYHHKPTDFNDLHCLEGLDEVGIQITKYIESNKSDEARPEYCSQETNNTEEQRQSIPANEQDRESGEDPKEAERVRRFPIEALGPYMANATKAIAEKTSAPIEMVCSSILAGAAICVQPLYNIEAFGSLRPLSLFFLTIAESGERKTTVDKIILSEHYKWRQEKMKVYATEISKYIDEIEEWGASDKKKRGRKPIKPKAPMLFVEEPTVEGLFCCLKDHRGSVGLFSDEGGSFLSGHSMKQENVKSTLAKFNQLWDGSPITRMRKGKDEGDMDTLFGKRVSLHLMMQPKLARELFNNEYAKSQGFLARCLTCEPKSKIGERGFLYNIGAIEEAKSYYSRVRQFLNKPIPESPPILVPSGEALKLIEAFYYEIEPLQASGGSLAGIRDFASKVVEHCIRMAAVITAFNCDDTLEIDSVAMSGAIEVGRFYLSMQADATESSATFPSRDCEIMYEFLTRRPEWKTSYLLQVGPKRFRKKANLFNVLKQLDEAGFCKFNAAEYKVTI